MNQAQKKELAQKLQEERDKTAALIDELVELTQPISPENAIGRISRMDAINNKSVNEAALVKARQKLENIERALGRIDEENFGKCVRCGYPIPYGRLIFMPGSNKCVNCAE